MATDGANARVVPAVFLISAAAMADEIFLIRLLSVRFWPHFVSLIVAQALLGFGASGVAIHLLRPRIAKDPESVFSWVVLLTAPSFEIAFRISQHVPFDPFLLLWHPSSWPAFALFFSLLAIPFFLAGSAVGVPLSFGLGRVGTVYAASFAGTAAGAGLSLAAFPLVPTGALLRVPFVLGLLASVLILAVPTGSPRAARFLAGGLSAMLLLIPPVVPSLSPYKDLAIARKLPESRTLSSRHGISGDFSAVASPGIHHAPGLSFRFEGEIPPQAAVFADGELRGVVPREGGKRPPTYLGFLPAALPYRIADRPAVAQFGLRGTEGVLLAAGQGAFSVTVVEPSAELARMVEEDLAGYGGGAPAGIRIRVRREGGRNFLAGTGERFDIIELADISSLTFSSLGIHATGETFLLSREGIRAALSRLSDDGMLAVSGWLKSPPRESVKILNTIRAELARAGLPAAGRFVVVRGWGSFVAVARKHPFSRHELAAAEDFCGETGFTMIWPDPEPPGDGTDGGEEVFRKAVRGALAGPQSGGGEDRLFDLRPVTDDSPYFHRFLNPRSLPRFRRILGAQWVPFAEWGVVFLVLSLAVSGMLAAAFLLVPLAFSPGEGSGGLPVAAYFSALGLGYILIELIFLKVGILLLGDPIRAAAAAVGGFCLASGIGSAVSGWWGKSNAWSRWIFPGIALSGAAGFLALFHGSPLLLGKGAGFRVLAFLFSLAPAAFLMGMPFPLALSRMADAGSAAIPYAWGVNGFFSVAGASLTSIAALWIGFHATVAAGAVLYLLAGAVFPYLPGGNRPES